MLQHFECYSFVIFFPIFSGVGKRFVSDDDDDDKDDDDGDEEDYDDDDD